MSDPFNHQNLFGLCISNTIVKPASVQTSIAGPDHPQGINSINGLSAIDESLSLHSASNLTSQYQAMPILGQFGLHQHAANSRMRRSSLTVPHSILAQSTSYPHPLRPQNKININIVMGNNSSININLLNNKPPPQFTSNNFYASSSSTGPVGNNLISPVPSTFKSPFEMLPSNQESILHNFIGAVPSNFESPFEMLPSNQEPFVNKILKTNESPQLFTSFSQHTSPLIAALTRKDRSPITFVPNNTQEIPTAIPCLRQELVKSSPHQGQLRQPCQSTNFQNDTVSQSNSHLSFYGQQSIYFPKEKHYHLPLLPSSMMKPAKYRKISLAGANVKSCDDRLQPLPSLPNCPESLSTTQYVSGQVSDPAKHNCLLQSHFQGISQTPHQYDIASGPEAQAIISNASTDLDSQTQRHQHYSVPYIKYGPYNCPECHVSFQNGYSFAAHVQNHYKDESPAEQRKRREGKIRNRDLYITETTAGITVMPGSRTLEDKMVDTPNVSDEKAIKTNQRERFASVNIKEEVIVD